MNTPAHLLARFASALGGIDGPTVAHRIVGHAMALMPGTSGATVTIRRSRGRHHTLAASSDHHHALAAFQHELREGAVIDACNEPGVLRSGDVAHDPRWPQWGPVAATSGARSVLAVRLEPGDSPYAALTLYAADVGAFNDPAELDTFNLYAIHAGLALTAALLADHLETGMGNRTTIGIAQGLIAERYGVTHAEAHKLLTRLSSHRNIKLSDIAHRIAATGEVPEVRG